MYIYINTIYIMNIVHNTLIVHSYYHNKPIVIRLAKIIQIVCFNTVLVWNIQIAKVGQINPKVIYVKSKYTRIN